MKRTDGAFGLSSYTLMPRKVRPLKKFQSKGKTCAEIKFCVIDVDLSAVEEKL